ncbi:MAG: helix-turn-helix domain-containing protein [Candidatus Nanoarchaeia archaeon]
MRLTHKIAILPSAKQETVLRELSERCRLLYNLRSMIKFWL